MKVVVVSDTHGNLEYLTELANYLLSNDINTLIFLGDECEDIEVVKHMFQEIIWVPGVYCEHYRDKNIPHRIIKEFNNTRVLITHTPTSHTNDYPDDIGPEKVTKQQVDIVLYGHTHIPNIEVKSDILWVNPGHLKKEDKKGYPPSFAVIDFNLRKIELINFINKEQIYSIEY
ncbi:MAG: YfcE family phosphodiesterase [Endomicrobia bacterium]|nr:YfcE family phosphodiesterase [Endomicrobiia bacterium]MDW8055369.1 YfcE family phosphodiesterase [Elusimicrobiota bacterium]